MLGHVPLYYSYTNDVVPWLFLSFRIVEMETWRQFSFRNSYQKTVVSSSLLTFLLYLTIFLKYKIHQFWSLSCPLGVLHVELPTTLPSNWYNIMHQVHFCTPPWKQHYCHIAVFWPLIRFVNSCSCRDLFENLDLAIFSVSCGHLVKRMRSRETLVLIGLSTFRTLV